MGRAVADELQHRLDKPVIVMNQPGAGSLIAAGSVAIAKSDGDTLLLAPVVVPAFFPHLYKKLSFDPMNDLVPVAELGKFSFALAVGPEVPSEDLKSFIAWVKANPGKISYGSLSAGTPAHFLGVLFNEAAGTDMVHVPYKGAAPVLLALQSGEIQAAFVVTGSAIKLHEAGKVRFLGVTGSTRSTVAPKVPTFAESGLGLKSMDDASLWYGFFAPKETSAATVAELNRHLVAALQADKVKAVLAAQDLTVSDATPAEFSAMVARDNRNWGKVIRSTGFTLDK